MARFIGTGSSVSSATSLAGAEFSIGSTDAVALFLAGALAAFFAGFASAFVAASDSAFLARVGLAVGLSSALAEAVLALCGAGMVILRNREWGPGYAGGGVNGLRGARPASGDHGWNVPGGPV